MDFSNHKKIIFFGSSFTNEKRKGIIQFVDALKQLQELIVSSGSSDGNILIVIAGNKPESSGIFSGIPFDIHFMGYINDDEKLSMIYQAADVFVCTSIQDSGPMMINEAIMCGTPVVSFEIGVVNDLVLNGESGFKIPIGGDVKLMAQKIFSILEMSECDFNKMVKSTYDIGLKRTSNKIFATNFLEAVTE